MKEKNKEKIKSQLNVVRVEASNGVNATGIKKVSIEDLAIMTANGFNRIDKRFDKIEGDIIEMKEDIREIKGDIVEIREDIVEIRDDIETIKDELITTNDRIDFLAET